MQNTQLRPSFFFVSILLLALLLPAVATAGHHGKHSPDIVETAIKAGQFETLVAAVKAAGLVDTLQGDGPFTVFAPTDDAFAKLPKGTLEELLRPENKERLTAILTYHVVSGNVSARQAAGIDRAATVNGQKVAFSIENGQLKVNDSSVVKNDLGVSNGVIHVIDSVLLPPELPKAASREPVEADELIRLAIERGVPLYNRGQQEACAAVYEIAVESLLGGYDDVLPRTAKDRLRQGLDKARTQSARHSAWTLRHALDDVYAKMETMDRSVASGQ